MYIIFYHITFSFSDHDLLFSVPFHFCVMHVVLLNGIITLARFVFIAREFITRALLAARADLSDILDVLTNEGVGTADGFNVNFAFLDVPKESRVFHTVEVTPKTDSDKSEVFLSDFGMGSNSLHTNRCVHAPFTTIVIINSK